MYHNLVVALSGTDDSASVLDHVVMLAQATGARVHVLHVRPVDAVEPATVGVAPAVAPTVVTEDRSAARDVVDGAVDRLTAAGVDATAEIVQAMRSDIAPTVVERAEAASADLVVVGSHQTGLMAALTGTVGERVARRCPCPVLLVP